MYTFSLDTPSKRTNPHLQREIGVGKIFELF